MAKVELRPGPIRAWLKPTCCMSYQHVEVFKKNCMKIKSNKEIHRANGSYEAKETTVKKYKNSSNLPQM